jgi:hypothetical protein
VRSAPRERSGRLLVTTALVLTATAGCGFLEDLADPAASDTAAATAEPSDDLPAVPIVDPEAPRVLAEGELLLPPDGLALGRLVVTAGPVRSGSVPPLGGFSDACLVDWPSLQYVALDVAFLRLDGTAEHGLAAHVSVARGASTPSDIGDVGVLVQSYVDDCADAGALPTTDTFWNTMGHRTTGYVILDQAVTAATPDGRADVFPSLELRISDLRFMPEPDDERPLGVGALSTGAPCADDAGAVCVPLG